PGRLADHDFVVAVRKAPLSGALVITSEQPRISAQRHGLALAGLELHLLECEEPHALSVGCTREIELRYLRAGTRAGIANGHLRRDVVAAVEAQLAVVERRVAQPIAERIQRRAAGLCIPAITDLGALV